MSSGAHTASLVCSTHTASRHTKLGALAQVCFDALTGTPVDDARPPQAVPWAAHAMKTTEGMGVRFGNGAGSDRAALLAVATGYTAPATAVSLLDVEQKTVLWTVKEPGICCLLHTDDANKRLAYVVLGAADWEVVVRSWDEHGAELQRFSVESAIAESVGPIGFSPGSGLPKQWAHTPGGHDLLLCSTGIPADLGEGSPLVVCAAGDGRHAPWSKFLPLLFGGGCGRRSRASRLF